MRLLLVSGAGYPSLAEELQQTGEVFTVESPAGRRRVGHENLEGMDGLEKG